MAKRLTLAERFWSKVRTGAGCWLWTAHTAGEGYGSIRAVVAGRWSHDYAHRVSWQIHFGPIPDGQQVLHHCDNPPCVRPDHLFLGTDADNMLDKVSKGRQLRGESHPRSLLTVALVMSVWRRRQAGERSAAIARALGVAPRTVRDVLSRKTWGHVAPLVTEG